MQAAKADQLLLGRFLLHPACRSFDNMLLLLEEILQTGLKFLQHT